MNGAEAPQLEQPSPGGVLRAMVRDADRTLLWTGLVILACAPPTLAMALLDPRVLDGANVWHKPLKFQMSVGVFLITLACLTTLTGERFRRGLAGRGTVWVAVATSAFEIVWITLQAARGERSHYNADSAFGTAMYAAMGIAAVALSLTPIAAMIGACLNGSLTGPLRTVRFGACVGGVVSLVGSVVIGLQLGGAPAHYPSADGGEDPRVPIIGWSLTGGDLRIAHFVGLHALQGMLIAGVVLARVPGPLARAALIVIGIGWMTATIGLMFLAHHDASPLGWMPAASP